MGTPQYTRAVAKTVASLATRKGRRQFVKDMDLLSKSDFMKKRYGEGWVRDLKQQLGQGSFEKAISGTKGIREKGLAITKTGDKVAIVAGGIPYYRIKLKEFSHLGKELAQKKALTATEIHINKLQQSADLATYSPFERGGALQKAVTMFKKAQTQYLREAIAGKTAVLHSKGAKAKLAGAKKIAIAHFLLPMTWQFISDGFEWVPEHQQRAAIFGSFNAIPAAGDALTTLYNQNIIPYPYKWGDPEKTTPLTSTITDFGNVLNLIKDGKLTDYEIKSTMKGIVGLLGKTTGFPFDPLYKAALLNRDLQKGKLSTEDQWRRIMGFSQSTLDHYGLGKKKKKNKTKLFR